METNALLIDPRDDVVTVLTAVGRGDCVCWSAGATLGARDAIPRGHKIAVHSIAMGAVIRKYGSPIGTASRAIHAGEHVHTHNLAALEKTS